MKPRHFVIPDIHGCGLTFSRLLERVIGLQRSDTLFLLGDTIDRGPRSREVLDTIRDLQLGGYDVRPVRGNHEEMLINSCRDRSYFRMWMINGGHETLRSFGVEDPCEIPPLYRRFMEGFPFFIEYGDFVLVHATLNFRMPDPFEDREAMLWSRSREAISSLIGGRRLIGGHTPLDMDEIWLSLATDRIMLDNGCVYAGEPGLGNLLALELETMSLYSQKNIDM
jgi:serine/threonine protein phosphatase 1